MITNLREQLMRDEGLRLKPYMDCCHKPYYECRCKPRGSLTIGYGHNLEHGIPETIAGALLLYDITVASSDLFSHCPWVMQIDEVRRDALVNITYNMGIGNLTKKNAQALAHAEAHNWSAAAKALLGDSWEKQTGDRARRLAKQLESGEWQ